MICNFIYFLINTYIYIIVVYIMVFMQQVHLAFYFIYLLIWISFSFWYLFIIHHHHHLNHDLNHYHPHNHHLLHVQFLGSIINYKEGLHPLKFHLIRNHYLILHAFLVAIKLLTFSWLEELINFWRSWRKI